MIYGPVVVIIINIFALSNLSVGIVSTLAFLIVTAPILYSAGKGYFGENRFIGFPLSALFLFFILSIMGSFFVILSSLTKEILAYSLLFISFPLLIQKIRQPDTLNLYSASFRNIFSLYQKKSSLDIISVALTVFTISLLVWDLNVLAQNRSNDGRWIWIIIPQYHLYILFSSIISLLATIFLSKNDKLRISLIIVHAIVLHIYIALIVGTLFGGDSWQMIGEIRASIEGIDRYANQGQSLPSRYIELGGLKVPERIITDPSRGIANAFAIYTGEMFQFDVFSTWPFLAPILWGIFVRLIIFRIAYLSSNGNFTFSLIFALSVSLVSELILSGAYSVKSSISFPFFLLSMLFWINYLRDQNKSSKIPIIITLLNVLNYSLFFVILLQISVLSIICKRKFYHMHEDNVLNRPFAYLNRSFIFVIIPLIMAIPIIDTIEFTKFHLPTDIRTLTINIGKWLMMDLSGANGPREAYTKVYQSGLGSLDYWFYTNLFIAVLVILGIFKNRILAPKYFALFLMLLISSHVTSFISLYLMDGAKPLGRYMPVIVDLVKIPFIASGIFSIYQWSKQEIIQHKRYFKPVLALMILICMVGVTVTSAQSLETKTSWVAKSDLDAIKYIVSSNNNKNFAVLSDLFAVFPLYAYTDGRIDGGGFYNDQIPDVLYKAKTREYYDMMVQNPSRQVLIDAAKEAGGCKVYLLMPSYLPKYDDTLAKLRQIMGEYKYFVSENQYTILFKYDVCLQQ